MINAEAGIYLSKEAQNTLILFLVAELVLRRTSELSLHCARMPYSCPSHKGCVQWDTYGYLGEYIENEGQYRHVDLYPLPSKSLLQVLRHGDHSSCDVNRHKDPAKSQKCPGSLIKRQRK